MTISKATGSCRHKAGAGISKVITPNRTLRTSLAARRLHRQLNFSRGGAGRIHSLQHPDRCAAKALFIGDGARNIYAARAPIGLNLITLLERRRPDKALLAGKRLAFFSTTQIELGF